MVDKPPNTPPTKEEFVEALRQEGINNLEDLFDAIMPQTGGYSSEQMPIAEPEIILDPPFPPFPRRRFPMPWGEFSFIWAF